MRTLLLSFLLIVLTASALLAQTSTPVAAPTVPVSDEAGIKAAALDYLEGWYEANPARMERALHPDLAKRIVRVDGQGRARVDNMSAMTLVQATRNRKPTPTDRPQQKDLTILDTYGNTAMVKLVSNDFVDYLQLGKVNDRWVIINVLWEMKPKPAAAPAK